MPAAGIPQVEMYELRLAARSRHVSEAHGPGTRELVVVLSGAMRMTVGDQSDDLGPGDSVVFDANKPHIYENPGCSEARYHESSSTPAERGQSGLDRALVAGGHVLYTKRVSGFDMNGELRAGHREGQPC